MKILTAASILVFFAGTIPGYSQDVGQPAPLFERNLLEGGKFRLGDHQGKVVFMFFFGYNCPSCKAIGPTVESAIYQTFKDNPDFVAVGLDIWDGPDAGVVNFKAVTGISFQLTVNSGIIAPLYETTYDRLLVVDRNGTLVHKGISLASTDIDNTVQAIEGALAEGTGASCEEALINITGEKEDPLCHGEMNGSIDLSVSGSNPDFTYLWSTGSTGQDLHGLAAGSYQVVVTDAEGCKDSAEVLLQDPDPLSLALVGQGPSCPGGEDGTIDLTASGGVPDLAFEWSNGAVSEDLSDLGQGTYGVVVTDGNGCMDSALYSLDDPDSLAIASSTLSPLCEGDSTGSVSISISGGTEPYQITWGDGSHDPLISNLPAGCYSVLVSDANLCAAEKKVCLNEPGGVTLGVIEGAQIVEQSQTVEYTLPEIAGHTYLWMVTGGTIVSGQGTPQATVKWGVDTLGALAAILESQTGCRGTTDTLLVSIQVVTDLRSSRSSGWRLFPNPVHDLLTIDIEDDIQVVLYDMSGFELLRCEEKQIDLSFLGTGVYLIFVKSDRVQEIRKIVKY